MTSFYHMKATISAPPVIEKGVANAVHADGELVRLKIYFSGTGPFRYLLTLNKEEVPMDHPNIHFVDFDNHVIITIPEIHSSEAGRYELTISNDSGEANTGFWLNVTGLPSAPQGPLQFSDVNRTQAVLSWKPPVVSISYYNMLLPSICLSIYIKFCHKTQWQQHIYTS